MDYKNEIRKLNIDGVYELVYNTKAGALTGTNVIALWVNYDYVHYPAIEMMHLGGKVLADLVGYRDLDLKHTGRGYHVEVFNQAPRDVVYGRVFYTVEKNLGGDVSKLVKFIAGLDDTERVEIEYVK